jgi:hypothetical protein
MYTTLTIRYVQHSNVFFSHVPIPNIPYVSTVLAFSLDMKREARALGLTGRQKKAGSCPNKILALYIHREGLRGGPA